MINLKPFQEIFPDDESCRIHFKQLREKYSIACKNCSSTNHYWLKNKEQWECKKCHFRTTLKSGTILQSSNLTIYTWYKAIYIIIQSNKILSSSEMRKLLGFKRYEPIWYMMHKIRTLMFKQQNKDFRVNECCEGFFKVYNRNVRYGELRTIIESWQNENPTLTTVLYVKRKKFVRAKIAPYLRKVGSTKNIRLFYSVKHIRGSYDARKSFFRQELSVDFFQKSLKIQNISKKIEQVKAYTHEIYNKWKYVSNKFLQLYLDEVSFNLNYKRKNTRLLLIQYQALKFYR